MCFSSILSVCQHGTSLHSRRDFVQIRTLQCCCQYLCSKGHCRFASDKVSKLVPSCVLVFFCVSTSPFYCRQLLRVLPCFTWQFFILPELVVCCGSWVPYLMADKFAPADHCHPWVSSSQPLFSSVVSAGRCKLDGRFVLFYKAVTILIIA